jgi:hypothetical protein
LTQEFAMTHTIRSTLLLSASLAGLLLLSACGKDQPATPTAPAPASTAAIAPTLAPAATGTAATPPAAPATAGTTAAVATSAAAAQTAAPVAPLKVAKLTLGSDVNTQHQVTRASSSFSTSNKTIYASVATEGSSEGATLNAKWSYLEGQGQLVSNISQSIATDGPAITTFKVQNPDLWPEGKYRVEISLDGKPVAKQDFEIKKS